MSYLKKRKCTIDIIHYSLYVFDDVKNKKFSTAPITACSLKLEAVWKVGLQVRNLGVKM